MRSFQRVFSSFTVLLSCATMANQFEDLEKTYARLNYALQVENNRRELPYRLNEFAGEVENLYAEGMDLSDLLEFVRSKFRNRKVIDEFEDLIDSIEPKQHDPGRAYPAFYKLSKQSRSRREQPCLRGKKSRSSSPSVAGSRFYSHHSRRLGFDE